MAWWQWGPSDAPHVVICVHGLSRQGRDFDVLAQALCERAAGRVRVVCPDVVGRGRSDWLQDPMAYQIPGYVADMQVLIQHLSPTTLDWVGTSMGGLIGMVLSALPESPIRRLVLNDVGPAVQWEAIQRISAYLGKTMRFATQQEACDKLWAISTGFGPHTAEQWQALTRPMLQPAPDSSTDWVLHYDPAIAVPVRQMTQEAAAQAEALMWQLYDAIRAKTLLLRGAESDLLLASTAQAMTQRGPKAQLVAWPGVGHAPTLLAPEQVQCVGDFLLNSD